MVFDVLIVGGSFAGQAAALQLGRARRRVLLVDAGRPRNRFAHASHGFLGQDGQPPSAIIATAAQQLAAYGTVERYEGEAVDAAPVDQGFRVSLTNGREEVAKRLILATGVRDILPALPGLQERWGISVLHCPYCHGYELDQRPLGVLVSGDTALHQAMLVPDWGPTTLFTQGIFVPTPDQQAGLAARGVTIEPTPVAELLGASPALEAVRLADGRTVELCGLFVAPQTVPASDLAERLGCAFKDGPTGPFIAVDGRQQTSVPGAFAAGDAASPMANATLAAAAGVMAAGGAHHSLIHGYEERAQK
ncbi:NAD(P)/FAD-dependent oxidoreductase [Chelativorans sp. AA-79]|uniref:NAD(P)/FAD-dependent oxidoreductase n=1 Tax=Chelativorans sp. AA-79 TaxID=3028735 RepID=UPI0023F93CA2|nr:NAD(P)/FAD-dependent oxidoreductase [Chelativorans sp. AA-79]WEX07686.1 NAD(P)/FAD-dependent oxidoreductase [Chelativorans sp. AA-79]